jgi:acyl-CoA synthetase (AMP-forming)/AMP-acid ligase II
MTSLGNRVVVDGRETTWADLVPTVSRGPVVYVCATQAEALAAVKGHLVAGTETMIMAAARVDPAFLDDLRADGFVVGTSKSDQAGGEETETGVSGRLWIATSGTTGRPKRIAHTLASLTTVAANQPPRTWLCAYSPGTYAWWQLVALSLGQPGQDLVMVDPVDLDSWPAIAAEHGVTAVSGTPTFWRQSLFRSSDILSALPLTQVTLGGEPVDQAILDRLHAVFPTARISWIYASSEVGAVVTVHDGLAGFPVAWLDRRRDGQPTLSVEDGELVVESARRGDGVEARAKTGDRVEIVDDRVLINGRLGSDEINVGGVKVSAATVRDVLQSHPGVHWARVRGRRAPIVGQVVAAEVVTDGTVDEQELRAWAGVRLGESAIPRNIRLLDEIPIKETLKSDV